MDVDDDTQDTSVVDMGVDDDTRDTSVARINKRKKNE